MYCTQEYKYADPATLSLYIRDGIKRSPAPFCDIVSASVLEN